MLGPCNRFVFFRTTKNKELAIQEDAAPSYGGAGHKVQQGRARYRMWTWTHTTSHAGWWSMTALIFPSHSRATFRIGCVFVTSVLYGVDQLLQPIPALLIHVPEGYPPSVASEGAACGRNCRQASQSRNQWSTSSRMTCPQNEHVWFGDTPSLSSSVKNPCSFNCTQA